MTYLLFGSLGLVLAYHRAQVRVEELFELLSQISHLTAVGVLDAGDANNGFKELALEDHFLA